MTNHTLEVLASDIAVYLDMSVRYLVILSPGNRKRQTSECDSFTMADVNVQPSATGAGTPSRDIIHAVWTK